MRNALNRPRWGQGGARIRDPATEPARGRFPSTEEARRVVDQPCGNRTAQASAQLELDSLRGANFSFLLQSQIRAPSGHCYSHPHVPGGEMLVAKRQPKFPPISPVHRQGQLHVIRTSRNHSQSVRNSTVSQRTASLISGFL